MMQGADDVLSVCTTEVQSKKDDLGPVVGLKLESDTEAARGEGHKTFCAQKIAGLLQPLKVWVNQKDLFARCRHELHIFQDLLDDARRQNADLEWFFAEERTEATIVKNLENVQGDERDVILFSITFTADAAGKRSMDFGALNRDGGERRLNVAVTRARQELLVFSGFTADLIDTARTKALGVHHLKAFLDFADRGAIALPAQDRGSVGGLESPFEEAVAEALQKRGWLIVPQVGISGFRIDIGIRHPDRAGAYLAGVECDGATYHSSATARDRDKVREQVLRGLGWNILRVWSTDWWFDADGAAERLHAGLTALLTLHRQTAEGETAAPAGTHWDMGHEVEPVVEEDMAEAEAEAEAEDVSVSEVPQGVSLSDPPAGEGTSAPTMPAAPLSVAAPLPLSTGPESRTPAGPQYRLTDLAPFRADPDSFHEFSYRTTLKAMVEAVLDCEAPLREDILAQRISRAHGWLRTGGRIRERIALHLRDVDRTSESSGDFVWRKGTVAPVIDYRQTQDGDARRSILEIPIAELASVAVANPDLFDEPDPALAMARLLGVERLAATSRERLEEAIERGRAHWAETTNC